MMGDNVIKLPIISTIPVTPERALQTAIEENMREAVIIGEDATGAFYFGGNITDATKVLWHLELARRRLLEMAEPA